MADKKVTALAAITAASNNDIFMIVDDPLGTPISKKITVEDVFGNTTKTTLVKFNVSSSNTNLSGTTLTLYPGTGGAASNVSVQGSVSIANSGVLRINSSTTPSSNTASTAGWTVGQIGWDANYLYVATSASTGGIKRVALTAF
jgi:hypothetical protein